jgi:peptidoglycan/xylan/chitin deacetylase (PgdA/CDA1 family)
MSDVSASPRATAPVVRRRAPPAVRLTAAVHAVGVLALVTEPQCWPWVAGALGCNYAGLFGAVMYPRGRWLGPNLVRLPESAARRGEVCLTFDDGPHPEITPRVLDLLDRHDAKASFFCVGEKAAAHPQLTREIARRGHGVENHSYRHSNAFAFYGHAALEREVQSAQAVIEDLTGRAPRFFRAPAGFRNPLLDAVLGERGLRYVSWTRRGFDTVDSDASRVLRRLSRGLAAADVLLLHDRVPLALEVLPPLLAQFDARGLKPVSLAAGCDDESPA